MKNYSTQGVRSEPSSMQKSDLADIQIFGTLEISELIEPKPLHSITPNQINDVGDLCDSDCIDCD